ncbi:sulfatase-like hydrolase/transferase [Flavivirga amylovorans]|uniref:Sulfatase-like hydrolase/transferase n=1 Tax=Flavivirga amylovorans TaxID=870486 RepID=A0ABT8X0L9_9FLAO|nr:sulfatase-like hydrolase/transferase [Flavivirga amylovorans]MDO5987248.1 sulfatase-like hydrolase/transferase [Flavivirga amylovorans]
MKLNIEKEAIKTYSYLTISLIGALWFVSLFELFATKTSETNIFLGAIYKLVNDFWSGLIIGIILLPFFLLLNSLIKKRALIITKALFILFVIIQFALVKYSLTTNSNLGVDILGYSFDDAYSTVSVSESISITYFFPFIIFPLLFLLLYKYIDKSLSGRKLIGLGILSIVLLGCLKLIIPGASSKSHQNKISFLVNDIIKFQREKSKLNTSSFVNRTDYPLLKSSHNSEDVLSPFLTYKKDKPNIVFIVVEGLGSEFVRGNQYSGFTPYIDSLISKSLYWENFVSTTGRSFGILPSLFGSLPYGETGFLDVTKTPSHISLISILKANGYKTSYYSGGPSSFDRKINFLEYNGIETLVDENKYGPAFKKTKGNDGGFSWGYPDSEIFRKALTSFEAEKQPRLDIVMTLSTHEPFEFPKKEEYIAEVDKLLAASRELEPIKKQVNDHKDIFGCLLYTDKAIKEFMHGYEQRPDYSNTIFIITGDHRIIPITQKDKLCRFHVPLLIYSPLLKKADTFKSISSHWDVTPSVLNSLMKNFKFKPLDETPWIGNGLDTTRHFRNIHKIPLMRYKGSINDFIYKDYFYSDGELFKINEDFGIYKVNEEVIAKTMADSLLAFKRMNAYVTQQNKIFPESLNIYVTPKIEFSPEQLVEINAHTKGKTYDEILFIARDLSFKKQYKIARLLCDFILNEYPNYTDAIIIKGRSLAWERNYEKSEKVLLNAIKRSPYYDDAYLAILDMYWWSGQDDKSVQIFNQAMKNDVLNPDISFKMAKAYSRLDRTEYAIKLMDSIIKIHPNNSDYLTFKKGLSPEFN